MRGSCFGPPTESGCPSRMSIFTKNCPVCGASQPREAERCGCGHRFDTSASGGEAQDLKSIYHEERLYRDYLAARVDEAAKATDKQALASARAELEAQEQRVRAVKKRLKLVRSNTPAQKPEAPAPAKPVPPPAPKSALPPAPPPRPPVKTRPASPSASVKPKSSAPTPQPPSARGAAPVQSNAGQRAAVRPRGKPRVPMQPARAATKPAPTPKVRHAAAPAAAALPTARTPSPVAPNKPAPSRQPGAAGKAAVQECPNCMAKVAAGVARCGCGFEMASHVNEMPSLPMSPEDRAAFLAALRPTRK
jgi:hypothetical protein